MAVGGNDANGVYIYGEDDNPSPFSTFLNKLGNSVSAVITAIKSRLATVETKLAGTLAQTYAPTLTGFTLGSGGSAVGSYTSVGNTVTCFVTITFGTGGGATGNFYVGFPVAADTTHSHVGTYFAVHGATYSQGAVELDTSTRALMVSTAGAIIGNAAPWSWGAGDKLRLQFNYIKAA